jgi:hypothetical protein
MWTWPLVLHFSDRVPGEGGDNYSFLWNLWWMRTALSAPELDFFHSRYLLSPFGVDLINHPHTALQGLISATVLRSLSEIQAENVYIVVSVFLNAACAYAFAFDVVRERRCALLAAVAFGGSPYIAAHLRGHFDLLTAWVIPLFALFFRRAMRSGSIFAAAGCGVSVAVAAYAAYYYVVYLAMFAITYTLASWRVFHTRREPRAQKQSLFTMRLIIVGLMALDLCLIVMILVSGGDVVYIFDVAISARTVRNPLLLLWLLAVAWLLTKWRIRVRFQWTGAEPFWRGAQALMITVAVFSLACLPLIVQAFRLALSGRYVSQTYFWRSAPRGVDAIAPLAGNPFHPLYGAAVSRLYAHLGLDRIEAVGWLGIVPIVVLLTARGKWFDGEEARRWKIVLTVFAIWAVGPFLTVAGFDIGLPLPQALARFVALVDNARMPGRAMVGVYLSLGVLMALRVAGLKASTTSAADMTAAAPTAAGLTGGGPTAAGLKASTTTAADMTAAAPTAVGLKASTTTAADMTAAAPTAAGLKASTTSAADMTAGAPTAAGLKASTTTAAGTTAAARTAAGLRASSATPTGVVPTFRSALRLPAVQWTLILLLALDYLSAPTPLTALDRPAVYEQLASISDNGAVIEVPFGIGDGLSTGRGSQNRRLLYYATIHGHPVVGGYIGRMPPNVAQAYEVMPVVGNLLRMSSGEESVEESAPTSLPFKYLVLDTAAASSELVDYVKRTLDMDLIASSGGKELYAVQGARPTNLRASR